MRQLYESESKLRMTTVLPLILKSKVYGDVALTKEDILNFTDDHDVNEQEGQIIIPDLFLNLCSNISPSDMENITDNIWPPLVYVAGYAAYAISKRLKCPYCTTYLKEVNDTSEEYYSLITENSRGGLCYPSESVIESVAYTYITLQKLLTAEHDFLQQNNQADILRNVSFQVIYHDLQIDFFPGHNCLKHDEELLLKMLFKPISNILLRNYIKKHNDKTNTKTMPHLKRIKPQKI